MRCAKCSADNRDERKFCAQCGAPLSVRCVACGAGNERGAKFCGDCGTALVDEHPAAEALPAIAEGERRHLTVLFSDLVNSTEIAARLDPEEWHDIAVQYQRAAADAVARFGGHVAKYLGDGLVVYFGWPIAHEDAAERAVRPGLGVVDAVAALNDRLAGAHDVKLAVRVGIHTGSVVIGRGGGDEAEVFGDAPHVAARVQAVAAPDSVLISSAVHDLVTGSFDVDDVGAHVVKGRREIPR